MEELVKILHDGGYSCVIRNGEIRTFIQRGVADLFGLYKNEPAFLHGAMVADKVVGMAAAALMVLGQIEELYTDVISTPALTLLRQAGITVGFGQEVSLIRNRDNTGFCPLETICRDRTTAPEMLPLIEGFLRERMILKP